MKQLNLWQDTPIANLYFYLLETINFAPPPLNVYPIQSNVNNNLNIWKQ